VSINAHLTVDMAESVSSAIDCYLRTNDYLSTPERAGLLKFQSWLDLQVAAGRAAKRESKHKQWG